MCAVLLPPGVNPVAVKYISYRIPLLPLWAFGVCYRVNFIFNLIPLHTPFVPNQRWTFPLVICCALLPLLPAGDADFAIRPPSFSFSG
jgi:hypothetical protein